PPPPITERNHMTSPPSPEDRAKRRDRALARRRRITAVAAAGGVAGVGLVGYLVAVAAPPKTAIPLVSTVRTVTTVKTVNTVITVGEDGVMSKTTTTTLSPGTATAGTPTITDTVSGGPAGNKKPYPLPLPNLRREGHEPVQEREPPLRGSGPLAATLSEGGFSRCAFDPFKTMKSWLCMVTQPLVTPSMSTCDRRRAADTSVVVVVAAVAAMTVTLRCRTRVRHPSVRRPSCARPGRYLLRQSRQQIPMSA